MGKEGAMTKRVTRFSLGLLLDFLAVVAMTLVYGVGRALTAVFGQHNRMV